MRTMTEREQWAEDHGYSRYRCPSCHRTFWSDSGPHCEYCDTPPNGVQTDEDWLDWMDSRHISDWTDTELQRYKELTGQVEDDPQSNEPFEKENQV